MKHLRIIFASVLCVLALTGCGRMALKKNLIAFRESQIVFPADLIRIEGVDFSTFSPMDEVWKLVVFADSTQCSSCLIDKLDGYTDIVHKFSERGPVLMIVILSPAAEDRERILEQLNYRELSFGVYLDATNSFAKLNPLVEKDPRFHLFLTDRSNHPVVVGDPLRSQTIFDLMLNQINYRNPL